jgi:acyl carrier protein
MSTGPLNARESTTGSVDEATITVVHQILAEIRPGHEAAIDRGDLLVEDWQLDSIDLLELITAIEDAADVDLGGEDRALPALNDVADACAFYEGLRSFAETARP